MAWRLAGHSFAQDASGGSGGIGLPTVQKVVDYVANGLEGTDFPVPIGAVVASATYTVLWAPKGVTNIPMPDFPNGVGDRTTSQFRVVTAAALTAGDVLTFYLFAS